MALVEGQLGLQPLGLLPFNAPLLVHCALGGAVVDEVLIQAVALSGQCIQLVSTQTRPSETEQKHCSRHIVV